MSKARKIELELVINTEQAERQIAQLRLLVSQIGFALDNYLYEVGKLRASSETGDEPE